VVGLLDVGEQLLVVDVAAVQVGGGGLVLEGDGRRASSITCSSPLTPSTLPPECRAVRIFLASVRELFGCRER